MLLFNHMLSLNLFSFGICLQDDSIQGMDSLDREKSALVVTDKPGYHLLGEAATQGDMNGHWLFL